MHFDSGISHCMQRYALADPVLELIERM